MEARTLGHHQILPFFMKIQSIFGPEKIKSKIILVKAILILEVVFPASCYFFSENRKNAPTEKIIFVLKLVI
jgi:hypothetical protein